MEPHRQYLKVYNTRSRNKATRHFGQDLTNYYVPSLATTKQYQQSTACN